MPDFKVRPSVNGTDVLLSGEGGGFTPDWVGQSGAGSLFSASGYGDPNLATRELDMGTVAAPSGANFGVTVARCVKFRLPKTLALSAVHLFGNAALGSAVLQFAIYPVGTGAARLWQSATTTSAANAWVSFTGITGATLSANTNYWFCQLWNSTSTVIPFRTPPAPVHGNLFGASVAPLGGRSIGIREFAQFTISAGVFPATLPAIASAAYASTGNGSIPPAFLEGSAS